MRSLALRSLGLFLALSCLVAQTGCQLDPGGASGTCAGGKCDEGAVPDCTTLGDAETNRLLADALALSGTPLCELGQPYHGVDAIYPASIARDPFRASLHDRLYYTPNTIPTEQRRLRETARAALGSARPVAALVELGSALWDEPLGVPSAATTAATFDDAILSFHDDANPFLRAELAAKTMLLPAALKTRLAPVLVAMRAAIDLRKAATPAGADLDRYFRVLPSMFLLSPAVAAGEKVDLSRAADAAFFLGGFWKALSEGARLVADAIERSALRQLAGTGVAVRFVHQTPYGAIVIGGAASDRYQTSDAALAGDLLLVVDTGGDDRYEVPVGGTRSVTSPVSVAIDLGGRDTYTYRAVADAHDAGRAVSDEAGRRTSDPFQSRSTARRQGAGSLGVGALFDLGTENDRYESLRFSQGSGVGGVGVLYDEGGDDSYVSEAMGQGGALFGMGILVDRAGNDTYTGYSVMQGGAYVKAVGMLVDGGGDDTYWLSPGSRYLAPDVRIAGHDYLYEYSVGQGAGWGRRADYPIDGLRNGQHASGGVGALLDLAGSDAYTCGAFCQGTGYWFGAGLLADASGDDAYYGRIFVEGSGVHFGLGALDDGGGNDHHLVGAENEGLAFGAGDDLSLGWFEDWSGDDLYEAGRLTLGSGSEKGIGVFLDHAGNDRYASTRLTSFGWAEDPADMFSPSSGRYGMRTRGVFVDAGGTDTYRRPAYFTPEPIGDGRSWLQPHNVDVDPRSDEPPRADVFAAPVTYAEPGICAVGVDR